MLAGELTPAWRIVLLGDPYVIYLLVLFDIPTPHEGPLVCGLFPLVHIKPLPNRPLWLTDFQCDAWFVREIERRDGQCAKIIVYRDRLDRPSVGGGLEWSLLNLKANLRPLSHQDRK